MPIRGERVGQGSKGMLKPCRAVAIRGEPRFGAVAQRRRQADFEGLQSLGRPGLCSLVVPTSLRATARSVRLRSEKPSGPTWWRLQDWTLPANGPQRVPPARLPPSLGADGRGSSPEMDTTSRRSALKDAKPLHSLQSSSARGPLGSAGLDGTDQRRQRLPKSAPARCQPIYRCRRPRALPEPGSASGPEALVAVAARRRDVRASKKNRAGHQHAAQSTQLCRARRYQVTPPRAGSWPGTPPVAGGRRAPERANWASGTPRRSGQHVGGAQNPPAIRCKAQV